MKSQTPVLREAGASSQRPRGINSPCCPAWRLSATDQPHGRVTFFGCFVNQRKSFVKEVRPALRTLQGSLSNAASL
jgi:hypothetical protein